MILLEFTDAETGRKFGIPESRFVRVGETENEERCKVFYEELGQIAISIVDESYGAVKVRLEASG